MVTYVAERLDAPTRSCSQKSRAVAMDLCLGADLGDTWVTHRRLVLIAMRPEPGESRETEERSGEEERAARRSAPARAIPHRAVQLYRAVSSARSAGVNRQMNRVAETTWPCRTDSKTSPSGGYSRGASACFSTNRSALANRHCLARLR